MPGSVRARAGETGTQPQAPRRGRLRSPWPIASRSAACSRTRERLPTPRWLPETPARTAAGEIARMRAADPGWARLLDHLADAGPSLAEDLVTELRMKRQEFKALRSPLERCGAVVSRSVAVTAAHGHLHGRQLARWDQVYRGAPGSDADPVRALGDLVVAGVQAAVLSPERELRRWFSWNW